MNLSEAYLSHLVLYIKSGDEDKHTLRLFLDYWFAYSQGGPFLNRNGKPRWFNNPDPKKIGLGTLCFRCTLYQKKLWRQSRGKETIGL